MREKLFAFKSILDSIKDVTDIEVWFEVGRTTLTGH